MDTSTLGLALGAAVMLGTLIYSAIRPIVVSITEELSGSTAETQVGRKARVHSVSPKVLSAVLKKAPERPILLEEQPANRTKAASLVDCKAPLRGLFT